MFQITFQKFQTFEKLKDYLTKKITTAQFMLYPKNIEEKLGFDLIRQQIKQECTGSLGQQYVDNIRFTQNYEQVMKMLIQTHEFYQILQSGATFPYQHFTDVRHYLKKIEIENAFLEENELHQIRLSLDTILQCYRFFQENRGLYPQLFELSAMVSVDKKTVQRIDTIIDENGKLRDSASTELQRIRKKLYAEQAALRKKIEKALITAAEQGMTAEQAAPTIRNGRVVIPILAEFKRKFKGFIHDESATGQTVFIEPTEVFEQNNAVRELELEEKREIIRILTQITDFLRPTLPVLHMAYRFLGITDFIRAKARLALKMNAALPQVEKKQIIHWRTAKHPILVLTFPLMQRQVVPFDLQLTTEKRILVISGPNAGGKSVLLKAVGLLQYMLQCGVLPTLSPDSTMGIFDDIFIDIGDEQSLENDLSTYSSHLTAMRQFLKLAEKRSLFLIDEMGSGTDPQHGGAIAEAVLEQLNAQKSFGVVTTHFSNLKIMAQQTQGLINGAMQFDLSNLQPKYELLVGQPGSSFAFEVAKKIGLPTQVLEKAQQKTGTEQVQLEKLLKELAKEKDKIMRVQREARLQIEKSEKNAARYEKLSAEIEKHKKQLLNEAKLQAKQLLKDANAKIEATIKEIKEAQAQKEKTKQIRQDLEKYKETLVVEEIPQLSVEVAEKPTVPITKKQEEPEEIIDTSLPIQVGNYVKIKDNGAVAEVVNIKGNQVEILMGALKSTVQLKRLEKISKKTFQKALYGDNMPVTTTLRFGGLNLSEKIKHFRPTLDLRGSRAEDALRELGDWLDEALLLGVYDLRILHGKGDGILRKIIRQELKKYKQVAHFTDEHIEAGGDGITLVQLSK